MQLDAPPVHSNTYQLGFSGCWGHSCLIRTGVVARRRSPRFRNYATSDRWYQCAFHPDGGVTEQSPCKVALGFFTSHLDDLQTWLRPSCSTWNLCYRRCQDSAYHIVTWQINRYVQTKSCMDPNRTFPGRTDETLIVQQNCSATTTARILTR